LSGAKNEYVTKGSVESQVRQGQRQLVQGLAGPAILLATISRRSVAANPTFAAGINRRMQHSLNFNCIGVKAFIPRNCTEFGVNPLGIRTKWAVLVNTIPLHLTGLNDGY
jgi:hypothetical protein